MNETKQNNDSSNVPTLSSDPIFVNDEIERLHRRIFHLRRTNTEIRKHYSDDADCIQALNENVVIIERNINALIVYFKLYHQLTAKQHKYTKLYESDLKTKAKLNEHSTYNHGDYFYNFSSSKGQKPKKLKEFDLDYVAQKLREKTKELEKERNKKSENNENNDDDDFIADDDGGFTL